MPEVSELFIYPIKSLGGIPVTSAKVTDRGFEFDRRWMLIDSGNNFLSQRECPRMAMLQVQLSGEGLTVHHKLNSKQIVHIPLHFESKETVSVQVWSDLCEADLVSPKLDAWFSEMLSLHCRLVYMPDSSKREVDSRYAFEGEITSFSSMEQVLPEIYFVLQLPIARQGSKRFC